MEKKIINTNFPYFIWAITIMVSPLFFIVKTAFEQANQIGFIDTLQLYTLFIIFGTIYSAPSLLIFVMTFNVLKYLNMNLYIVKALLSLIGVTCILTTFYLVDLLTLQDLNLFYGYSIILIVSVLFVKYKKFEETKENESKTD